MTEAVCISCRFWERREGWKRDGKSYGECHRNAPEPGTEVAGPAHWPVTIEDDWCGDWGTIDD